SIVGLQSAPFSKPLASIFTDRAHSQILTVVPGHELRDFLFCILLGPPLIRRLCFKVAEVVHEAKELILDLVIVALRFWPRFALHCNWPRYMNFRVHPVPFDVAEPSGRLRESFRCEELAAHVGGNPERTEKPLVETAVFFFCKPLKEIPDRSARYPPI